MKYQINYEAVVYNIPVCKGLEICQHIFSAEPVTTTDIKERAFDYDIFKINPIFLSCCIQDENGHIKYVVAKNIKPIKWECVNAVEDEIYENTKKIVIEKIKDMEHYLIFKTNLHIFFPIVKIYINTEQGKPLKPISYIDPCPIIKNKDRWRWYTEKINIGYRLRFNLDEKMFNNFLFDKKHARFNRSFNYYLHAFRESDYETAFCFLCTAIDAITGCSKSGQTTERFAKYSSVLFCRPLQINDMKTKMRSLYAKRSTFIHGKRNDITINDELELREIVRKFLLNYYLFWMEMDIKNEEQMLQKLDEIYSMPKLYMKYVPAEYSFIRVMDEEKISNKNSESNTIDNYRRLISYFIEAYKASSLSDTDNV